MKTRYKKARIRFAVRRTLRGLSQNANKYIVPQIMAKVKRVRVGIYAERMKS